MSLEQWVSERVYGIVCVWELVECDVTIPHTSGRPESINLDGCILCVYIVFIYILIVYKVVKVNEYHNTQLAQTNIYFCCTFTHTETNQCSLLLCRTNVFPALGFISFSVLKYRLTILDLRMQTAYNNMHIQSMSSYHWSCVAGPAKLLTGAACGVWLLLVVVVMYQWNDLH